MQTTNLFSTDFVANISDNIMIEIAKSGEVLFFNDKAACVFAGIKKFEPINNVLSENKYDVLKQNIDMSFYQQYPHHFYWIYQGRFYLIYVYPQDSSVWLSLSDITEKRQQAHLLHKCNLRNKFIESLTETGFWELDVDKRRFYWSDGVYKIFEIDEDNKKTNTNFIKKHIYYKDLFIYKNELAKLLKNKKKIQGQIRIITQNNNIKICKFFADYMFENGETKIVGIFQDITSDISVWSFHNEKILHDLKHYLQLLKLQAEKVKKKNETDGEIMENILQNISVLLEINSLDADGEKEFDLGKFIVEIAKNYAILAENSNLKFEVKSQYAIVKMNRWMLERLIFNLLQNSFKFAKTKVCVKNTGKSIWIADDGCGLSVKSYDDIFESSGDLCKELRGERCGKGLRIVREMGLGLGIKIKLRSVKGKYCAFGLYW